MEKRLAGMEPCLELYKGRILDLLEYLVPKIITCVRSLHPAIEQPVGSRLRE